MDRPERPSYGQDEWERELHDIDHFRGPKDPRPPERETYGKAVHRYPHMADHDLDVLLDKLYKLRVATYNFIVNKTQFAIDPPDGSTPKMIPQKAARRMFILQKFAHDLSTDIDDIAGHVYERAERKGREAAESAKPVQAKAANPNPPKTRGAKA